MITPDDLKTQDWYLDLAHILASPTPLGSTLSLIDLLIAKFEIDSTAVIHYPLNAGPSLLFQKQSFARKSKSLNEYFEGIYVLDPFYDSLALCRDRYVLTLHEVIGSDFKNSEYYQVHYASAGFVDEICFCCDDRQNGFVVLSLSRTDKHGLFSDGEARVARTIAPLVLNYLGNSWRQLSNLEDSETIVSQISSEFHHHLKDARMNFGKTFLTSREFEVTQHLLLGHSTDHISAKLGISPQTFKVHKKHIYQKLSLKSQAEIFSLFLDAVCSTPHTPNADVLALYLSGRGHVIEPIGNNGRGAISP